MNYDEHNLLLQVLRHGERHDGNHYLAQFLAEASASFFGNAWFSARIPSLLLTLGSIFLWARLARRFLSPIASAGLALSLLANGFFLFNSVSNRAYPLGLFLSTLWLTSLIRYTEESRGRDAGYAVAALLALVGLGAQAHRMLYFTAAVGSLAFLFWMYRNRSGRQAGLLFLAVLLAGGVAWPYLWEIFVWERDSGRALRAGSLVNWRNSEGLAFLYTFGWDRAWQALLGFVFLTRVLYEGLKQNGPSFGECFWIFVLLALPATGIMIGEFAWEPRFFFFLTVPGLFFLSQSIDRLKRGRRWYGAAASVLFILVPLIQAPRLFFNSGGQHDLVNFLDVAARRVAASPNSCVRCSGAGVWCAWVRQIYLAEARGFRWGDNCRHTWVIRIAGNDTVPLPIAPLRLNFGYRRDFFLYEYTTP